MLLFLVLASTLWIVSVRPQDREFVSEEMAQAVTLAASQTCRNSLCHADIGGGVVKHAPVSAGACLVCHTAVPRQKHRVNLVAQDAQPKLGVCLCEHIGEVLKCRGRAAGSRVQMMTFQQHGEVGVQRDRLWPT